MKNFNSTTMGDDFNTSQSNLNASGEPARGATASTAELQQAPVGDTSESRQRASAGMIVDEMSQDLQYLAREAPLDGGESTFGAYSVVGGAREPSSTVTTTTHQYTTSVRRTESRGQVNDDDEEEDEDEQQRRLREDGEAALDQQFDYRLDVEDEDEGGRRRAESPLEQQQFVRSESVRAVEQMAPDNVEIHRPLQQAGLDESAFERLAVGVASGARQQAHTGEPSSGWPTADADADRPQQQADDTNLVHIKPKAVGLLKPFLVSFMVDARGGAMRGCRHSGVRVIIPPGAAQMPTRITCRYLRRERLVHPPPLMEGEACASKIMEVGPAGAKFLAPVLIEVPHFASLRGKEREIIILRSDTGEVWREHLVEADDQLIEQMIEAGEQAEQRIRAEQSLEEQENWRPSSSLGGRSPTPFYDGYESAGDNKQQQHHQQQQQQKEKRLTRIVTTEFPQYFAIISRIRQEVHTVGPDGSTVDSQVVSKVQAIFTEGALTKRIKIGLQNKTKQDHASEADAGQFNEQADVQQQNGRPQSPGSQQSTDGSTLKSNSRPSSKARRRRFLACFGGSDGQGSLDQLNVEGAMSSTSNDPIGSSDSSTASSLIGGDSPRVPVNEKLVEKRIIVEDISDSEGAAEGAPNSGKARKKRHVAQQLVQQLVPDDYYIEQETPLILNMEPTTYGKRMADNSAQTDSKSGNSISFSTRANEKSRRMGLLGGRRRRNKQHLTIHCAAPTRPSIESGGGDNKEEFASGLRESSKTPTNGLEQRKSRTCIVQTDSDSVIVNYVTIHSNSAEAATQVVTDDGYVSGSGELKKQHHEQRKGLFSPFCASARVDEEEEEQATTAKEGDDDASASSLSADDRARAVKVSSKKAKKAQSKSAKKKGKKTEVSSKQAEQKSDTKESKSVEIEMEQILTASDGKDIQPVAPQSGPAEEKADESAEQQQRSMSPSSKDLKLKIKLDKQEKARKEKLERQQRKEAEEAAAKAEKERKRLDKEAKKAAKRVASQSFGAAATSPEPETVDSGETNTIGTKQKASGSSAVLSTIAKTIQNVKFAPSPTHRSISPTNSHQGQLDNESEATSQQKESARQLDSLQQVIESSSLAYEREKERLSQEDGRDLVRLSIGGCGTDIDTVASPDGFKEEAHLENVDETLVASSGTGQSPPGGKKRRKFKLPLKFSLGQKSSSLSSSNDKSDKEEQRADPIEPTTLKPILKQQQSTSSSTEEAEVSIGEPTRLLSSVASQLVSEATDEAVRVADALKEQSSGQCEPLISLPSSSAASPTSKEAKRVLKAEAEQLKQLKRSLSAEEKRLAKEAKCLAKEADAARKRAEMEANKAAKKAKEEAERQADIAKIESERAMQALELASLEFGGKLDDLEKEVKKVGKLADQEAKRIAKEASQKALKIAKQTKAEAKKQAKADAQRAAQEAKKKLRGEKKEAHSQEPIEPSLPLNISNEENVIIAEPKQDEGESREIGTLLPSTYEPTATDEGLCDVLVTTKTQLEEQSVAQPQVTTSPDLVTSSSESSPTKSSKSRSSKSFGISLPKFDFSIGHSSKSESAKKQPDATVEEQQQQQETIVVDQTSKYEENVETNDKMAADPMSMEENRASKSSKSSSFSLPKFSLGTKDKKKKKKEKSHNSEVEKEKLSEEVEPESAQSSQQPAFQENNVRPDQQMPPQSVEKEVTVEEVTQAVETVEADASKSSKKAKKRSKRQKSSDSVGSSHGDELPSVSETASKSSFLGRLFRSKPKAPKAHDTIVDVQEAKPLEEGVQKIVEEEPVIISEMYLSDPNDADGEMILEVNVPKNLIRTTIGDPGEQQQHQQTMSASSTVPTTTDDQEATLVNISQMADDEDADEATENVVSQAMDLDAPIVQQNEQQEQQQRLEGEGRQRAESPVNFHQVSGEMLQQDLQKVPMSGEQQQVQQEQIDGELGTQDNVKQPPQALELKDEKKRRELEAKLEKEAKKREKEEAKLKEKREKEAKKLAKLEAKKQAQEDKANKKREASEAKRLEKLAKLESKADAKRKKDEEKENKKNKGKTSAVIDPPKEEEEAQKEPVSSNKPQPPELTEVKTSSVSISRTGSCSDEPFERRTETIVTTQSGGDELAGDFVDMSNAAPVNEETEVERIVEEEIGEDGTVTKRTKVVETKYVTLRQEEIRMGERRDIPVEEWQRMQEEEQRGYEKRSRASSTSDSSIVERIKVQVERSSTEAPSTITVRPVVGPYEHKELDEILATPSYFSKDSRPPGIKSDLTPKRELKERFKLNRRLIKLANKLAKTEAKRSKSERSKAQAQIAVCDEAAREARKQLKHALKESRRATKVAAKLHKKMDKIDKKLGKRAAKIEQRQKKLDKRAAKLTKKASKKAAKEAKKEEKRRRSGSLGSGSSNTKRTASIRREDIGPPVLRSSSRMSIGGTEIVQHYSPRLELEAPEGGEQQTLQTITSTVVTESPDGQLHVKTSERVLTGQEAEEAALRMEVEAAREEHSSVSSEDDEVIVDVVGDDDDDDKQQQEERPKANGGEQLQVAAEPRS